MRYNRIDCDHYEYIHSTELWVDLKVEIAFVFIRILYWFPVCLELNLTQMKINAQS